MQIVRIKAYSIASPVTDWTMVKVETNDPAVYGWGECSLPTKPRGVLGAIADLEKLLAGAEPTDIEWIWQRMYRHSYWRGGPILCSSISGIDTALWDIRGKLLKQPLYKLLGGAVRKRVKLYANLGLSTSPDEFRKRAGVAMEMGYRAFKIYPLPEVRKIEGPATIRQIVACCEAMRDAIGPQRDFAIDCHGRASSALAVQIERAVRHTSPLWIEEPVPAESTPELRRCAAQCETPLAAGERLFTRWGFRELLEGGLVSIIQPDVSNAGGVSEMMKLASMAELYGVAFNPHNPNGPLQSQTSLHLAAAAPAFEMLEHRHEHHDYMAKICTTFPKVDPADGCAALPHGVGLGTDVNEDFLRSNPARDWIPEAFRADASPSDW
jgi:galactonate dehydratase